MIKCGRFPATAKPARARARAMCSLNFPVDHTSSEVMSRLFGEPLRELGTHFADVFF
jgi:hypothetical protein